jgi:hypothetical protein
LNLYGPVLKHCHDFTFIIKQCRLAADVHVCGISSRWGKRKSAKREEKVEGRAVRTDVLRKDTRSPVLNASNVMHVILVKLSRRKGKVFGSEKYILM